MIYKLIAPEAPPGMNYDDQVATRTQEETPVRVSGPGGHLEHRAHQRPVADSLRSAPARARSDALAVRSEEHTSEPSHANISYAVFCLKKKTGGGGGKRNQENAEVRGPIHDRQE